MVTLVRNRYLGRYNSQRGGIRDARWLSPYSHPKSEGGGVWANGELSCMGRGGCPEATWHTFQTVQPSRYVAKAAQQRLMVRLRKKTARGAWEELDRTPRMKSVNLGRKKKHGRQYE